MVYLVSDTEKQSFERDGYVILPNVIDGEMLTLLREECAYFVGYTDATMRAQNREIDGITHRGKRYFIGGRYRSSNRLYRYIFGQAMASITGALLGETVYLFNEQWVVKGPEQGMKFAWHQDSGYVKYWDPETRHQPYLTCWCALDNMTEGNGTISVLPHDLVGTRNRVLEHTKESGTNDLVGYRGTEDGALIEMDAGSIAVFSSTTLHRSGPNMDDSSRRVYLTQYSLEPILTAEGALWGQAVPFIQKGQNVYDQNEDFLSPQVAHRIRERLVRDPDSSKGKSRP